MNRYITTTLPYVNAEPHIGFALELVQADALARLWRASGDDVFFNTGTDEHGQKISEAAEKAGRPVQEYVDHHAAEVQRLKGVLDLSTDAFIRTTDAAHIIAAEEMWRRCAASGDIYKKEYEGLYCVGHEAFITEKELVDGVCPEHGAEPRRLREENYFFKFSKYQSYLLEYLARPNIILPESRRNEALNFVKGGLEDFSVSREKVRLSWGIPVPGDNSQVMYVWFDALTNYLSTLGWPQDVEGKFKKYWEEGRTLQVAGKDQIRFQSLIWQAMLKSAGVKATDQVFYHGFITSGGTKMSKSLGNVISPYDLVKKYGTDATRYLLLRHAHPTEDSDITWERLDEWYTANLANGLGNLVARVMKLAESNSVHPALDGIPNKEKYSELLSTFDFNGIMNLIWEEIQKTDQLIHIEEPFKLIKTNPEEAKKSIAQAVISLSKIATMLGPFMPTTSENIQNAILQNKKPKNLFPRL